MAHAQVGWYATPSLRLTEEFDDNVFLQPGGKRSDLISRFSPGVTGGFRSATLSVEAGYTFDAEVYVNNPELSDPANRQRATAGFRYLPSALLTLGLDTSYVQTETPSELTTETGLVIARRSADELTIAPSAVYRVTPATSADFGYSYGGSRVTGGLATHTQHAQLGLAHRVTPLDTGTLGYRLGVFDSEGTASVTSHALLFGWSRRLTQQVLLDLRAGPRLSDGTLSPEVSAGFEHRFEAGRLSLGYSRSETVVVGQAGRVETESLVASVTLKPTALLELHVAPAIRRTSIGTGGAPDITVYAADAGVSYRIARWLRASAAYRFSLQEQGRIAIRHNVLSISLELSQPLPVP